MMLYAVTSPCTPGAMPVPLIMTIAPGETASWMKLAAFANVTPVGPGSLAVRLKLTLNVDVVAVTTIPPALGPAVTVVEACPFAPVGVDAEPTVAPPVTVQVTVAPCTGFPLASTTDTTSGAGKAVPISVVCASPETFAIPADGILTVMVNVADTLPAVTFTCAFPAMLPSVASAEASPLESDVLIMLLKVTVPGVTTDQVTGTPPRIFPNASVT